MLTALVNVLQRNRINGVCVCVCVQICMCIYTVRDRGIYFKELVHMVVGTGNSETHAGWAGRLETQAGADVAVLSPKFAGQTGSSVRVFDGAVLWQNSFF